LLAKYSEDEYEPISGISHAFQLPPLRSCSCLAIFSESLQILAKIKIYKHSPISQKTEDVRLPTLGISV
jgi:hypothetical protein